jgi:hypothetical protein
VPTGEQPSARDGATPPPATTHPTQRRLRSVEVDALVECYQAGATITQLVERFRISRTTVMAHLARRGVQRRAVAKQWDHKKLASAARSYADGSSLAMIAARFGLDPSTVANRFRRAGVPIRPDEDGVDRPTNTPERDSRSVPRDPRHQAGSSSRVLPDRILFVSSGLLR